MKVSIQIFAPYGVESSEQQRVEAFNQALVRNEKQIKKLEDVVLQLDATIKQYEPFAAELINVVNLIETRKSWAQPGLLATLLEWRSAILGGVLLMAFASLVLSGIAWWRSLAS